MKKRKSVPLPTPSAADIFREAMESGDDRESQTLSVVDHVIRMASRGDGPLVIVGAGIDASNIIDNRPCVHCNALTDAVSIFHPPPGVIPAPPKTTVAVIATLCDDCVNLFMQSGDESEAIAEEVMDIVKG